MIEIRKDMDSKEEFMEFTVDDKDIIFSHVYNSMMQKLHPVLFPKWPTPEDHLLLQQMIRLRKIPFEKFKIKLDINRNEIWNLVIKSIIYLSYIFIRI